MQDTIIISTMRVCHHSVYELAAKTMSLFISMEQVCIFWYSTGSPITLVVSADLIQTLNAAYNNSYVEIIYSTSNITETSFILPSLTSVSLVISTNSY